MVLWLSLTFAFRDDILQLEEERQRLRVLTTFHANPAVVLQQPAFEPEYPVRPPLAPLDLHLYTEKRAAEREQFEHSLRQKELEEEQRRQEVTYQYLTRPKDYTCYYRFYILDVAIFFSLFRSKCD